MTALFPALFRSLSRLAGRMQAALMLSLAASAPAMMLLVQYAPDALPVLWRFPAAAVLLTTLCMSLSAWRRLLAAVLSAAAILALGAYSLPLGQMPGLVLLPLGACAVLFASLPLAAGHAQARVSALYTAGLFIQLGAHIVAHLSERMPRPQYTAVIPAMTAVFIVYLLLCLFALNRHSLTNATMARHSAPASMRRFNTVLVLLFMGMSLALAAVPAVARMIVRAWDLLVSAVGRVIAWLASLMPASAPMGPGGGAPEGGMPFIPYEAAEPSLFAVILERVVMALSFGVLLVLLALAARVVWRKLRALAAYLFAQLQRYVAAAAGEEDEITDTREEGGERRRVLPGFARRRPEHDPKTPVGRIRLTYARLLRRHADWAQSSTARENLPETAAALYEQARYSDHAVSMDDAERFSSGTKKL